MVFVLQIGQLVTVVSVFADRQVPTLFACLERVHTKNIVSCDSAVQTSSEKEGEWMGSRPID